MRESSSSFLILTKTKQIMKKKWKWLTTFPRFIFLVEYIHAYSIVYVCKRHEKLPNSSNKSHSLLVGYSNMAISSKWALILWPMDTNECLTKTWHARPISRGVFRNQAGVGAKQYGGTCPLCHPPPLIRPYLLAWVQVPIP